MKNNQFIVDSSRGETTKSFSILCPSRGRPKSLKRLFESIKRTTSDIAEIEVLVYIDDDDSITLMEDFSEYQFVRFFVGPRIWMSLAQNVLFALSSGKILMACADDFVFKTNGWDFVVQRVFGEKSDVFWLIYGNDLGVHAGKIPTHFFIHRSWPITLGYWVHPGRASLWDLWVRDIAIELGRLHYLEQVVFEHLNFRQTTSSDAVVDSTTMEITNTQKSFRPKETYQLLSRERRIDIVLLAQTIQIKPPWKFKYIFSHLIFRFRSKSLDFASQRRLLTLTNQEILKSGFFKILRRFRLR